MAQPQPHDPLVAAIGDRVATLEVHMRALAKDPPLSEDTLVRHRTLARRRVALLSAIHALQSMDG